MEVLSSRVTEDFTLVQLEKIKARKIPLGFGKPSY